MTVAALLVSTAACTEESQPAEPTAQESRPVTGEVVFTTGMSGYQESMTDPSFARQLITFTAPHAQALEDFWWAPAPKHLLQGVAPAQMAQAPNDPEPEIDPDRAICGGAAGLDLFIPGAKVGQHHLNGFGGGGGGSVVLRRVVGATPPRAS